MVDGAVAFNGYAEQQVAVFRYDVHQHVYHLGGTLVAAVVVCALVVMPVADAGAGLPVFLLNPVGNAALHIPKHVVFLFCGKLFSCNHYIRYASVQAGTVVVIVRENVLSHGIVASVERHGRVVKIEYIGVVVVDKLQHTVLEFGFVGG